MADKLSYLEAVHNRRSIYQLNRSSLISDMIEEIIHQAIEDIPSSFNSQSTRLVVLLKEDHYKFWNVGLEGLKAIVPADSWPKTGLSLEAGGFGANLQHYNPLPDERAAEV
ncbi:hypothetical protein BFJ68_g14986 [Fusarium oxysporum]|uniref:Nitroreductase domain-containing protein n=1 Tax=Fusarium oxysporum TaxID=5507 RepID=A0A420PQW0_FUSOX|nr:hypothetical protein BFJ71_g14613 [Fusarium oxysporum]RKK94948.1 hypothetical protein BFJ68_g14986 [Fusarium oxysporum]